MLLVLLLVLNRLLLILRGLRLLVLSDLLMLDLGWCRSGWGGVSLNWWWMLWMLRMWGSLLIRVVIGHLDASESATRQKRAPPKT